jgi:hypothetical protein
VRTTTVRSASAWTGFPSQRTAGTASPDTTLTSATFGEPAEASIYHYIHHRFETVDLQLIDQHGRSLRAVAAVSGDIDGLGIDPVRADAWLTFTGILVSLHDATSPHTALSRLGQFTDTTGLAFDPDSGDAALRFIAEPD